MSDEQIAFKVEHRGFVVTALYDADPKIQDAHIVITRDGTPFKEFDYPAYRIWNIAAHPEMVEQLCCDNHDVGLLETVEWIVSQGGQFFAECSLAEEILVRCKAALAAHREQEGKK